LLFPLNISACISDLLTILLDLCEPEPGDQSDGEETQRPRKKKKRKAGPGRRKAVEAVPIESMVATRDRRKITRTKKAQATPPESEEDSAMEVSEDSEDVDMLDSSDSEYSD
jgi:hypothetical protein